MSPVPDGPVFRFDDFFLDVPNRQLRRDGTALPLNARYFDALALLVREHGRLVEKDRLFDEVWRDVVVSDAALTQCIKDIRKRLGDDAANPRFIETVPRYGYRFIAPVEQVEAPPRDHSLPGTNPTRPPRPQAWQRAGLRAAAGTLGGGVAGVIGGLIYGLGTTPTGSGLGAGSVLLVLVGLNVAVGLAGGLGVSVGLVAPDLVTRAGAAWRLVGAALGGMIVGGLAKLLGVDAFTLLFGQAPAGITGGIEGAILGAALAAGVLLGGGLDASARWRPVLGAGLTGAVAGLIIPLTGGRLMGGSLDLVARSFTESQLRLDALGRLAGELHFGPTAQVVLGGIEGLLFGLGVVGALVLARGVPALRSPASARLPSGG